MLKDISKTIHFGFTNKFTKQHVMTIDIPFLPFFAIDGYYSDSYKKLKDGAAFKCEKELIKGKVWFTDGKSKRIVLTMASGLIVDIPYDFTEKDRRILLHHMEGFKMACAE
jgi:hypothetical protein